MSAEWITTCRIHFSLQLSILVLILHCFAFIPSLFIDVCDSGFFLLVKPQLETERQMKNKCGVQLEKKNKCRKWIHLHCWIIRCSCCEMGCVAGTEFLNWYAVRLLVSFFTRFVSSSDKRPNSMLQWLRDLFVSDAMKKYWETMTYMCLYTSHRLSKAFHLFYRLLESIMCSWDIVSQTISFVWNRDEWRRRASESKRYCHENKHSRTLAHAKGVSSAQQMDSLLVFSLFWTNEYLHHILLRPLTDWMAIETFLFVCAHQTNLVSNRRSKHA